MSDKKEFVLPAGIVSPTDVARLLREIESIDNYFRQAAIRQGGDDNTPMPRMSKLMDSLASDNEMNMLQEEHRQHTLTSLEGLHASAPVMHISFSVDPPGSYVQKIVAWIRGNIHAQALVTVGLQPNIGAGCVVRTNNKIFDFSLREYFSNKRDFFVKKMHDATLDNSVDSIPAVSDNEDGASPPVADSSEAAPVVADPPPPLADQPVVSPAPEAPELTAPSQVETPRTVEQAEAVPTPIPTPLTAGEQS